MLQLENVDQEMSFYWLYHSHPANQLVSPSPVYFYASYVATVDRQQASHQKINGNTLLFRCISFLYLLSFGRCL